MTPAPASLPESILPPAPALPLPNALRPPALLPAAATVRQHPPRPQRWVSSRARRRPAAGTAPWGSPSWGCRGGGRAVGWRGGAPPLPAWTLSAGGAAEPPACSAVPVSTPGTCPRAGQPRWHPVGTARLRSRPPRRCSRAGWWGRAAEGAPRDRCCTEGPPRGRATGPPLLSLGAGRAQPGHLLACTAGFQLQ